MHIRDQNAKRRTNDIRRTPAKRDKTPREVHVPELFQILISCGDEGQQRDLYERLTAEGYECRVLTL